MHKWNYEDGLGQVDEMMKRRSFDFVCHLQEGHAGVAPVCDIAPGGLCQGECLCVINT